MINLLCYSFQLCAELKQVQTKLAQVEQSVNTQASECERQQQKIRDLELELARTSTSRTTTTSLQEELQAERARLIAADRKVSATLDLSESTFSYFLLLDFIATNISGSLQLNSAIEVCVTLAERLWRLCCCNGRCWSCSSS